MNIITHKNDIKTSVMLDAPTLAAVQKRRAELAAQTGVKLSLSALLHAMIRSAVAEQTQASTG